MTKKCVVGGQAVIEGVLMKNNSKVAIAVRKPDGKISIKKEKRPALSDKYKILGWPFVRGVVNLIDMLVMGMQALNYSANESLGEKEQQITKKEFILTTLFAFIVAIGLFVILPLYLTKFTQTKGIVFNVIDGLIRIIIFMLYIFSISLMKDVKRLFQYHGAEHKTVHCYEAGDKLTIKNVKKYSTLHNRCGTTFLLFVLAVSIVVFSFVVTENFWIKLASRIILLPLIAGISYEILKLGGKYPKNPLMRVLVWPGLMLQKITTKNPDEKQIEVAIKAFNAVIK